MTFADTAFGPNRDAPGPRATLWKSKPHTKTPVERSEHDEPTRAALIQQTLLRLNSGCISVDGSTSGA